MRWFGKLKGYIENYEIIVFVLEFFGKVEYVDSL